MNLGDWIGVIVIIGIILFQRSRFAKQAKKNKKENRDQVFSQYNCDRSQNLLAPSSVKKPIANAFLYKTPLRSQKFLQKDTGHQDKSFLFDQETVLNSPASQPSSIENLQTIKKLSQIQQWVVTKEILDLPHALKHDK